MPSEGLLLLTTDKKITRLLFQSSAPHKRAYLVLVKNEVSLESLQQLATGVALPVKGGEQYISKPADVRIVEKPAKLFVLQHAMHEYPSSTWLSVTLTEGKYHQVRKMVAAIHHRCLRLIRLSIENITLDDLQPGCIMEMEEKDFYEQLNLTP